MTTLFQQYENDYSTKAANIASKLQAISTLSQDQKPAKLREVELEIGYAERVIQRMDIEARSSPPDVANQLTLKIKQYKADISKFREQAKALQSANTDRAQLGLTVGHASASTAQRERLLQSTASLNATSERIKQGKQQLLETEELGASILQDLHSQRQTIERARDTLHGADDNISHARKLLQNMSRWRFF